MYRERSSACFHIILLFLSIHDCFQLLKQNKRNFPMERSLFMIVKNGHSVCVLWYSDSIQFSSGAWQACVGPWKLDIYRSSFALTEDISLVETALLKCSGRRYCIHTYTDENEYAVMEGVWCIPKVLQVMVSTCTLVNLGHYRLCHSNIPTHGLTDSWPHKQHTILALILGIICYENGIGNCTIDRLTQ